VDSSSHNEYFGVDGGIDVTTFTGCDRCHVPHVGYDGSQGRSARFATESSLRIPNQSMSGFCSTCHGNFHSSGTTDLVTAGYGGTNGVSGAFLRHPSDYVIPNSGEYAAYTTYDITAPVARQTLAASSDLVAPGTDMVMCLSCHAAHGTEHDGMLRFDYEVMTAGFYGTIADAQAEGGCLACHTTKGVAPANR
jgi:cytochrome c553